MPNVEVNHVFFFPASFFSSPNDTQSYLSLTAPCRQASRAPTYDTDNSTGRRSHTTHPGHRGPCNHRQHSREHPVKLQVSTQTAIGARRKEGPYLGDNGAGQNAGVHADAQDGGVVAGAGVPLGGDDGAGADLDALLDDDAHAAGAAQRRRAGALLHPQPRVPRLHAAHDLHLRPDVRTLADLDFRRVRDHAPRLDPHPVADVDAEPVVAPERRVDDDVAAEARGWWCAAAAGAAGAGPAAVQRALRLEDGAQLALALVRADAGGGAGVEAVQGGAAGLALAQQRAVQQVELLAVAHLLLLGLEGAARRRLRCARHLLQALPRDRHGGLVHAVMWLSGKDEEESKKKKKAARATNS